MPPHSGLPEQFGRYRILGKLGEGGMGAVYLAHDGQLDRKVALKVPHFTADDGPAIERFRREARLAASIDHPNLCSVHEVGAVDGVHYFTMPHVEGTPLSRLIRADKPWPSRAAVDLLRPVALALSLLHQKGIIHRDLKPSNIMVRKTGEPVLMDFGLARTYTAQSRQLTRTGSPLGTPAYMSPEQVEADPRAIGPATDVYSLGVILYEMMTGQLPFEGPMMALFAQILHATPERPSAVRPGLDADIDALCLRALAKKPAERFASMSAFAAALVRYACPVAAVADPKSVAPLSEAPPLLETAPLERTRSIRPQKGSAAKGASGRRETESSSSEQTRVPPSGRRPLHRGWLLAGAILIAALPIAWMLSGGKSDAPSLSPSAPSRELDAAGLDKEVINKTLSMKLVLIPAGTFTMGSAKGAAGADDDEVARHQVKISRSFYMGTTEVTKGQFGQFVQATQYKTEAEKAGAKDTWKNNSYSPTDAHPVLYVSWNDAVKFCEWLSREEKETYELPTEAEWEYACRAGSTGAYSSGDDVKQLGDYAWYGDNSGYTPHPVGTKKANAWGLFDMHGNAWEWCADGMRAYPKEETKDVIKDPKGPVAGTSRVLRGGSWGNGPRLCRSAYRVAYDAGLRIIIVGFRVVLRRAAWTP